MKFGVHTGPQNCTCDDLRRAWHVADGNGFEWLPGEVCELSVNRVLPGFADSASAP